MNRINSSKSEFGEMPLPRLHQQELATMTTVTSRRAILAGAAALATVPALATSSSTDPIFAAIEQHKIAFHASQTANCIQSSTVDAEWSPEYDPIVCKTVDETAAVAHEAAEEAAYALTTIQPTTIPGLLALMGHVAAFNEGAFAPEIDRNWKSRPADWPAVFDDTDTNEIDLFGYAILANVREALAAMTVQS
jgi:hypothetical protein